MIVPLEEFVPPLRPTSRGRDGELYQNDEGKDVSVKLIILLRILTIISTINFCC